jgi:hypothetical protein
MRSPAYSAVLLPTWRAVVDGERVGGCQSGQQHCSPPPSLPDTTPVDCFISRVSSMLQIPQMRSNHILRGSIGKRHAPLVHSLSSYPCRIVRYHSTNNPPSHVL